MRVASRYLLAGGSADCCREPSVSPRWQRRLRRQHHRLLRSGAGRLQACELEMSHCYAPPIRNVSCHGRSPVRGWHRLRRPVGSQVRLNGRGRDDCRSSPRRPRQPQALLCHSSGGNSTGHLCHDRLWPSSRRRARHPGADGHTHHPLHDGERANHAQAPMVVDPRVLR